MSSLSRVLTAAALLSACNAFAQSSGDEATIIVTATRFAVPRWSLPVGATVITAKQVADSAVTTLPEALVKLGGVAIRNNSGSPDPQLDLRGFGASGDQNTLVLRDGQRISENEQVPASLSAIPLDSVERIEILPGSGAVLYGSGATGGTINIITKSPRAGVREATVGASLGSYDARVVRAGLGVAAERVGLTLHADDSDSDNYRRNNHLSEQDVEGDLALLLDRGEVHAKLGGGRQRLRLPGSLSAAEIAADRRGTHNPNDRSALDTWHATLSGRWDFGGPELAADFAYRHRTNDSTLFFFGTPSSADIDADIRSFTPRLRLPYRVAAQDAELVVGMDWNDWDYRRALAGLFPSLIESTQRDTAAYFLNTLRLGTHTRLALGARRQRSEIEQTDRSFAPAASQSQVRDLSAFETSARYSFVPQLSAYGRWGLSFRTANVDDNGFTSDGRLLQPQTSHDGQIGLELALAAVQARLAGFQSLINNEIHFLPSTVFPPFGANINLPPTRHRGIEAEASWQAMPSLGFSATYRYTLARFRTGSFGGADVAGNEVPLVPRHRASLNANWQAAAGLLLTANARYVGTQRYDNDQTNTFARMPAYTVVDLKLTQRLGPWKLTAQVDNLFGEKYYSYAIRNTAGTSFDAYPEAERRFLIGAEYAFR